MSRGRSVQEERRRIVLPLFNTTMQLTYEQRQLAYIWCARHQTCPTCSAPPYKPCLNLSQLRRNCHIPTRNPHSDRMDWARLLWGLRYRNYISEDLYQATLRALEHCQ